jgi:hypothetical protein
MKKPIKLMKTNPWGANTMMKDYLMRISTDDADVSIEPRNDIDTILLSIESEHSRETIALDAHQAEKLAAMLNIAAGIAEGRKS